jgi:hypothetical protein
MIQRQTSAIVWAGVAAFALVGLGSINAYAGPGEAQGELRKEVRAGTVLSQRDIERRVLPTMPGAQYLGPEYDPLVAVYRLKFIKEGHVVFIDVDGRSGEIIQKHK